MLCPECQSFIQEDTTSCPVCGEEIRPTPEKPPVWHRNRRGHLIIAAVFLAIVAILYLVIAIDPGASSAPVVESMPEVIDTPPENQPIAIEEAVAEEPEPVTETTGPEILSDEDLIIERIHLFNDAWLDFVHTDSRIIENHVTGDSDVYRVLRDFDREGLTERFLVLDVQEVTIEGETAVARVHEVIEKTRAGQTWSDTYHWRYTLHWEENQWLIDRYTADDR